MIMPSDRVLYSLIFIGDICTLLRQMSKCNVNRQPMSSQLHFEFARIISMNVCHLSDGSDVLYNKFNPAPHPNSNYSCVVAAADQWTVSLCDDQHLVTCQSNSLIPGNYPCNTATRI